MKYLLFSLTALPLLAGTLPAAERLANAQMDRIAAGASGCLVSVPPDGMTCLLTAGGIPAALLPAPAFPQTSPTTIVGDLQKFFNIPLRRKIHHQISAPMYSPSRSPAKALS